MDSSWRKSLVWVFRIAARRRTPPPFHLEGVKRRAFNAFLLPRFATLWPRTIAKTVVGDIKSGGGSRKGKKKEVVPPDKHRCFVSLVCHRFIGPR